MRVHRHQPFGLELVQRLTYGHPADTEFGGQMFLAELRAFLQCS